MPAKGPQKRSPENSTTKDLATLSAQRLDLLELARRGTYVCQSLDVKSGAPQEGITVCDNVNGPRHAVRNVRAL